MRAQWLSGRVLDLRPRGCGFKPHPRHCVVPLSKNINPSLVLGQPRKTRPFINERLLMGRKESIKQTNQTNFSPVNLQHSFGKECGSRSDGFVTADLDLQCFPKKDKSRFSRKRVKICPVGAQWLSGRVLDSRPSGCGFEPHRRHYVVPLSKHINPSSVLFQPRKTLPFITERLFMGRKESNQTSKICPEPGYISFSENSVVFHSAFFKLYILTDFNNATLTSPYIFQKTVECKVSLLQ